mmetsp:Transcript_13769/g.45531  ORF Transcript_13769/g.45531 Transcript_13769/m.45531 type:complete len:203 (+) Transcript_13769:66-674(+)
MIVWRTTSLSRGAFGGRSFHVGCWCDALGYHLLFSDVDGVHESGKVPGVNAENGGRHKDCYPHRLAEGDVTVKTVQLLLFLGVELLEIFHRFFLNGQCNRYDGASQDQKRQGGAENSVAVVSHLRAVVITEDHLGKVFNQLDGDGMVGEERDAIRSNQKHRNKMHGPCSESPYPRHRPDKHVVHKLDETVAFAFTANSLPIG